MICIATFYSHFGAMRFKKACDASAVSSQIMPVPRTLSSSCGTCVRFESDTPPIMLDEIEQIVACEADGYRVLYHAESS